MEVEKGVLLDGGDGWGIARTHCSYCLSDMSVQVVVGTVLRHYFCVHCWCMNLLV